MFTKRSAVCTSCRQYRAIHILAEFRPCTTEYLSEPPVNRLYQKEEKNNNMESVWTGSLGSHSHRSASSTSRLSVLLSLGRLTTLRSKTLAVCFPSMDGRVCDEESDDAIALYPRRNMEMYVHSLFGIASVLQEYVNQGAKRMLMPKSEETMECQVEEGRRTGPYPLVSGFLMLVSARVGFIDRVRRARCRLYGGHVRF